MEGLPLQYKTPHHEKNMKHATNPHFWKKPSSWMTQKSQSYSVLRSSGDLIVEHILPGICGQVTKTYSSNHLVDPTTLNGKKENPRQTQGGVAMKAEKPIIHPTGGELLMEMAALWEP